MSTRDLRGAAFLFVFGAVAGSLLDALHTHSGTTVYARPWFFAMSAWTPLIFGLAGLTVGLSYPLAERLTKRRAGRLLSWTEAWLGFALFAGLYAVSAYLPSSAAVKLVVLTLGAAGLFAWLARTTLALALAALTAILGPLVESALVGTGFFAYTHPDFLGIAVWLPALYAAGSVAFGSVGSKVMQVSAPA